MRVQCKPPNTRLPARTAAASGSCRAHDVRVEKLATTAAVAAAGVVVSALPALAADAGALSGDAVTAAGAIVGVAGLGGLLIATDPQRRRTTMAQGSGGDEMSSVKDYFEGTGSLSHSISLVPLQRTLGVFYKIQVVHVIGVRRLRVFIKATESPMDVLGLLGCKSYITRKLQPRCRL